MSVVIIIFSILTWAYLYSQSAKKFKEMLGLRMNGIKLQMLAQPMLFILDKIKIAGRFPLFFYKVQQSITKLEGQRYSVDLTFLFIAEMMTYSWGIIILGAILSAIQDGDMTMLIISFLLAIMLPAALYNDLSKKVIKRERLILLELPELLNKIILLVGAGSTVQQVITQCLRRRENERSHPLYKELFQLQKDWEAGYSFQQALEAFSKRCGVQEVAVFSTTLLLNYRRGGQDFVLSLKELSHSLWEKRKTVSKTLGEQASSKLVFPMVFIFIALIILIGSPAFMIMNF
jgi:tight adherence protein C